MAMANEKKSKPSWLKGVVESGGKPPEPKYNFADFIYPASDNKGHSSPVGFRCDSKYLRNIDVLVSSRRFPYKTGSDLLRHALHAHLHYLAELEPSIPVRLSILDTAVELARAQQMLLRYQNTVREIATTVEQLTREGLSSEARKLVKNIMQEVEDDPIEDAWKDRLGKELLEKYGYLFPSGGVVLE
jgi:hypothetical protein